jgi:hypothetical protein
MDLDPERLVFIDETWTATNMTRSHGRCRRGERLRMGYPHGHRKTTTLVAGLRMTGMVAPMVLDGPINGNWFEAYVDRVLVPELKPGDIVVMDMCGRPRGGKQNLSCPLLSGPSTMTVWTKEGTTHASEEAQARGDHRQAA